MIRWSSLSPVAALLVAAVPGAALARGHGGGSPPHHGGSPPHQGGPPPHHAGPPHHPGGPHAQGPHDLQGLADELGLKPQQRDQVRDLADEAHKQQVKLRAEIEVAGVDLRRELERDDPEEAKVTALVDKISGLEAQAKKVHLVAGIKIRRLLTKEQKQKLRELHERRAREWRERHRPPQSPEPPRAPAPPPARRGASSP